MRISGCVVTMSNVDEIVERVGRGEFKRSCRHDDKKN